MSDLDPRQFDLRRLRIEASRMDCPNGPDPETGEWPCDPQGYFGVMECQVCGRVGVMRDERGKAIQPETENRRSVGPDKGGPYLRMPRPYWEQES